MRFFTADHHFCHENIIKYCSRPFQSVEEMNSTLVRNWNEAVGPDDEVYHLGDVGFGSGCFDYLSQCNGWKTLILGNHDRKISKTKLATAFETVIEGTMLKLADGNQYLLAHDPNLQPVAQMSMLTGHVHDMWKYRRHLFFGVDQWNVGVDVWDFRPVREDDLLEYIKMHSPIVEG